MFPRLGYIYGGAGENFQIPSLVGRMPLGKSESHDLGETGGAESVALTVAQLPAHGHSVAVNQGGGHVHPITAYSNQRGSGESGLRLTGVGNYPWQGGDSGNGYYQVYATPCGSVNTSYGGAHNHTASAGNTGSGQAHPNMPPFLALNFIIKT